MEDSRTETDEPVDGPIFPRSSGPTPRPKERIPWNFDLRSIMILILVLAVGLGLAVQIKTLAFGVLILAIGPAVIVRSAPILVNRKRSGRTTDFYVMCDVLLESFLVVFVLLLTTSMTIVIVGMFVSLLFAIVGGDVYGRNPSTNLLFGVLMLFAEGIAVCAILHFLGRKIYPPKD